MFVTDNLPELGSDLVDALASLDVDNFSHCGEWLVVVLVNVFPLLRLLVD